MPKLQREMPPERAQRGPSPEHVRRLRDIHTHAVKAREEAEALTEILEMIEKELVDPSRLSKERLEFLFQRWEELYDQRENLAKDSRYLTDQLKTFLEGGGAFPS